MLPQEEVKKFEAFAALARESAERANEAEADLGEIPDEFLGNAFPPSSLACYYLFIIYKN
jgi:hypothetical protein